MDFHLSQEQKMIRDMARDFAAGEIEPVAAELDKNSRFPTEILAKAAGLGLMGVMVPPEYGGAGMDMVSYVLILEEIAKACASTSVILGVHNTLAQGGIIHFASDTQKRKWLPRSASGEILGAYLLTEPGAGSDAGSLSSRADRVDGGYRLTGSKAFITNGGPADFGIIYALTDPAAGPRGISAFIIDLHGEGVEKGPDEKKLGIHASSTCMISFEDAFVPEEDLIGEPGKGLSIALAILDWGRIGIAGQALGIADAALAESIKYSSEREQFGAPIARFQSIQWKLAEMATRIDASRLLTYRAASFVDEGRPVAKEAAMAKSFASKSAVWCAEEAVQVHGGYGYTKDYKVERLFRDARVTEIYEGTSEVQQLVIAKQIARG